MSSRTQSRLRIGQSQLIPIMTSGLMVWSPAVQWSTAINFGLTDTFPGLFKNLFSRLASLSLSLTGTTIALRLKPSTAREMYSNSTFEVGKLTDLHQPLAALVAANQDSVAEILMDRRTRVRATYTPIWH